MGYVFDKLAAVASFNHQSLRYSVCSCSTSLCALALSAVKLRYSWRHSKLGLANVSGGTNGRQPFRFDLKV
jgi:hypothetical protein